MQAVSLIYNDNLVFLYNRLVLVCDFIYPNSILNTRKNKKNYA